MQETDKPVAVGFGISKPEHVKQVKIKISIYIYSEGLDKDSQLLKLIFTSSMHLNRLHSGVPMG